MKKLTAIFTIIPVVLFASQSFAASGRCTVKKTEGDHLVIDCGNKSQQFRAGDKIKIKSMRKDTVEGC